LNIEKLIVNRQSSINYKIVGLRFLELKGKKLFLFYICYVLLIIEITSRTFLAISADVPFFKPGEIVYTFYPELREIQQQELYEEDGVFDILLLGGSALHPEWGHIERILRERLSQRTPKKFRIHNVSQPAHTSRDSYVKYKQLSDKHFDVVVFYHAINEVRANNCPPAVFKPDYSHYSWYRLTNFIDKHQELQFIAFPYVFNLGWLTLQEHIGILQLLPTHRLKEEWIQYGSEIKTAQSFENNLTKIIEIARRKKEAFVLLSYAFYVPNNYTRTKFVNGDLDYSECDHYFSAIETWGKPQHVVKGIIAHDNIIKEIARKYSEVDFVDLNTQIPKQGEYFCDICHFSYQGSQEFVDSILNVIFEIMEKEL